MSKTASKRAMVKPLSTEEASALAEHEFTISQGLAAFVAVGLALLDIRERKLYRTEFKTFDEYCRRRWNFGARRGEQLMAAAEIAEEMRTSGSGFTLENERQARALAGVPPHLREEVLDRVKEQGEQLTEQAVTRATIAILEEVREQAKEQADRAASAVLCDDDDEDEEELEEEAEPAAKEDDTSEDEEDDAPAPRLCNHAD